MPFDRDSSCKTDQSRLEREQTEITMYLMEHKIIIMRRFGREEGVTDQGLARS